MTTSQSKTISITFPEQIRERLDDIAHERTKMERQAGKNVTILPDDIVREAVEQYVNSRQFDITDNALEEEDEEEIDPVESFREAWSDIKHGRIQPIEDLWKELDEE